MLSRSFPLTGGVARVLLTFARYCEHQRLQLHIASFRQFAPTMEEALAETGTAVYEVGDRGYLGPALALRAIIKEHSFDLVVATSLKPYLVAKLVSTSACKILYWIHSIALVTPRGIKGVAYRCAARRDTLIYISEQVRKAHHYVAHKGREAVVLNGVEDMVGEGLLSDPSQREVLGIPCSAFVLGYTAEFIAWKEHKTLLASFSRLSIDFPDMHLLLIGTGELWEKTRVQAREIPGAERIHFLGPRADARRLLGIMDVYVHPSNGEGFGVALVEAMLARCAVVVSDAGALPEIIDDGITGLIFRVSDANDLANKIVTLALDQELRRRLGKRARQVALERFGAKLFAERITSVLESEPRESFGGS